MDLYEVDQDLNWLRIVSSSINFILNDLNRYDDIDEACFSYTPIDDLNYLWNVRGYCPENYSQANFAECTASNVVLSNVTDVKPTFTVPTDLCIDNISTDEKSCCENNGGNWLNIG